MTHAELPRKVFAEGQERGLLEAECRGILQGPIDSNETFHEFALNLAKLVGGEEEGGVIRSSELTDGASVITLNAGAYSTFVSIEVNTLSRIRFGENTNLIETILSVSPDGFNPFVTREVFLSLGEAISARSYVSGEEQFYDRFKVGTQKLTPPKVKDFCQRIFDAYENQRSHRSFHP